jgi:hypothetical protein
MQNRKGLNMPAGALEKVSTFDRECMFYRIHTDTDYAYNNMNTVHMPVYYCVHIWVFAIEML